MCSGDELMAQTPRPGRTSSASLDHADSDAACDTVTTGQVLACLAGEGPPTRHRENKCYRLPASGVTRPAAAMRPARPCRSNAEIACSGTALHLLT